MAKKSTKVVATKTAAAPASKRSGYKRKSNKRVNVLSAQLGRVARKAQKAAQYKSEVERSADAAFRAEFEKLEIARSGKANTKKPTKNKVLALLLRKQ